jgi:glutamate synthase (NADPH/NADH) large chain
MDHRGACGCEYNTGDGAGILTGMPHEFLRKVVKEDLKQDLPELGRYAAGIVFLPRDAAQREACIAVFNEYIETQGQRLLGWRVVPTDAKKADVGRIALQSEPNIQQVVIAAADGITDDEFDRQIYLIRKQVTTQIRTNKAMSEAKMFYVNSLSPKVIVYKGMLMSWQVLPYYPDLTDQDYKTHLAMVHSRFSTNTFPSWDRAQPLRFMSHNGEINTLRGNTNWMQARQGTVNSKLFGDEIKKLFPLIEPDCSDSGTFDNVLEFLLMSGRTLQDRKSTRLNSSH